MLIKNVYLENSTEKTDILIKDGVEKAMNRLNGFRAE